MRGHALEHWPHRCQSEVAKSPTAGLSIGQRNPCHNARGLRQARNLCAFGHHYGYFVAASFAGALAVAGLLYCAAAMREPGAGEEAAPEQSLLADIAAIPGLFRSNGPLVRVFGVIVIGSICLGMFGKNVLLSSEPRI